MYLHVHNDKCPTCGGPVKKCPHCGHVDHEPQPHVVPYCPPVYPYPYYPYWPTGPVIITSTTTTNAPNSAGWHSGDTSMPNTNAEVNT